MGRIGLIDYEQVAATADTMVSEGFQPTILSVRSRLGVGGTDTVRKHLATWREAKKRRTDSEPSSSPSAQEVAAAANILVAEGKKPTLLAVREMLKAGSQEFVLEHLVAWREQKKAEGNPADLNLWDTYDDKLMDFFDRNVWAVQRERRSKNPQPSREKINSLRLALIKNDPSFVANDETLRMIFEVEQALIAAEEKAAEAEKKAANLATLLANLQEQRTAANTKTDANT